MPDEGGARLRMRRTFACRHPLVVRLRSQQSRKRMRERGHKRMGLWLSGPADDLIREIRAETGMSFSEILDRLLLHPDAERCVVETGRDAPDEPLF